MRSFHLSVQWSRWQSEIGNVRDPGQKDKNFRDASRWSGLFVIRFERPMLRVLRWVRGEVQVNQFDILYINREHALPEQFPLQVKFLADASKNVAAKCEKKLAICSNIQTPDARFENFVAEVESKGFRSGSRLKRCKIVLWTIPALRQFKIRMGGKRQFRKQMRTRIRSLFTSWLIWDWSLPHPNAFVSPFRTMVQMTVGDRECSWSGSKGQEFSRCKSVIGTVRDPVRKANASC